jgi:hypothetical protein
MSSRQQAHEPDFSISKAESRKHDVFLQTVNVEPLLGMVVKALNSVNHALFIRDTKSGAKIC